MELTKEMELANKSKTELLELCKELNIKKYLSKNKSELIVLIENALHHCTFKTPDSRAVMSGMEPSLCTFEMCKDIKNTSSNTELSNVFTPLDITQTVSPLSTIPLVSNLSHSHHKINSNVEFFNTDIMKYTTNIKFDLIYLDPPYETNREFTLNSIDDNTGFTDIWEDSKYMEWIDKLICKLKELLSNNGSIIFHISSENSFVAETVLRKYFKKIQKIYWKRCHGKNTVKNKLGEVIDIIFVCNNGNAIFNMITTPISEDSVWAFKNKDSRGEYSLGALKHDRTRIGNMYAIEKDGVTYENKYGWKLQKDVVENLIKDNRIHFAVKQKNMYIKVYKHEHKGVPLSNLWNDIHSITRTSKDPRLYPTQKPQKLLERIIKIYSNENSYILDPVCGSGTTGFVGDKLNRKCILCDINPDTLNIIKKRFTDGIYNI